MSSPFGLACVERPITHPLAQLNTIHEEPNPRDFPWDVPTARTLSKSQQIATVQFQISPIPVSTKVVYRTNKWVTCIRVR